MRGGVLKGKYFLDEIDGIIYSTDSYEWYNLYNKIFFEEKKIAVLPAEPNPFECHAPANKDSWLKALEEEKKRYDNGYKWIRAKWRKGKWVKVKNESN